MSHGLRIACKIPRTRGGQAARAAHERPRADPLAELRNPMGAIRCLCLDVDGVLTDGRVWIDEEGRPLRAFHIQDGIAVQWFARLCGEVVLLTGKQSAGVAHRAAELGVRHVIQNSRDKLGDLLGLLTDSLHLGLEETAMVGDDLPDLPVMLRCGYPIAVANAAPEVRHAARYVTSRGGGEGAVREAVEHLLKLAGKWEDVLALYRPPAAAPRGAPRAAERVR